MSRPGQTRPLPALAARAQLGDRPALEALLRELQRPLLEHVRAIVRDDDLASDVLQEVLLIICRRLHTVRETEWIRAWAYRIATREAVRAVRRARREEGSLVDLEDLPPAEEPDIAGAGPTDDQLAELPSRLAMLPPRAQLVLRMHYLQSFTLPEVAAALEVPLGTVKSRLAYGLARLREARGAGATD